jgi:osmotically-inducible protein OsmY
MQPGDAQLKQQVEEILRTSSLVDEKEVTVSVRDSVVTLTGNVDSAIEKRRARQLAEDIQGVRLVDDQMKVKNWVKRTDEELAAEVQQRLRRDAYVEGARIEVRASNGEVVLDGNVPDYHTRKAAEDVTWWTPGVIGVENLLLVTDEDFVDVSPLEVPNA